MSIDLDSAVSAHVNWKIKLQMAIDGGGETLDPSVICQDNKCELGKWLYGSGAVFRDKAGYEPLRLKHAAFHRCASEVATKVNEGDKAAAQVLLNGSFHAASQDTVMAIIALKLEVS